MTTNSIRNIIKSCLYDVVFIHNGKPSGITSTVSNGKPTFQSWFGDDTKEYSKVEDVLKDKFYDGKSLLDLLDNTEFTIL